MTHAQQSSGDADHISNYFVEYLQICRNDCYFVILSEIFNILNFLYVCLSQYNSGRIWSRNQAKWSSWPPATWNFFMLTIRVTFRFSSLLISCVSNSKLLTAKLEGEGTNLCFTIMPQHWGARAYSPYWAALRSLGL